MTAKLLLFLLLAPSALTQTKPTKPLSQPEKPIAPFTVWQLRPNATDETQVTNTTLNPQGYWLLAYVDLKSPATPTLLTALQTLATNPPVTSPSQTVANSTQPLDPTKLVIIAANATGAELTQFALKYPFLTTSAWTHDQKSQAATTLGITGTPHLIGMHEGQRRWQYAGTLNPTALQPIVLTWTTLNTLPPNKLTLTKHSRPTTGSASRMTPATTVTP